MLRETERAAGWRVSAVEGMDADGGNQVGDGRMGNKGRLRLLQGERKDREGNLGSGRRDAGAFCFVSRCRRCVVGID